MKKRSEEITEVFSRNLYDLLEEKDISAKKLSKITGISEGMLSNYGAGKRSGKLSEPSAGKIKKIAMALDTSSDYLLGLEKDPKCKPSAANELGLSGKTIQVLLNMKDSPAFSDHPCISETGALNMLFETVDPNIEIPFIKALLALVAEYLEIAKGPQLGISEWINKEYVDAEETIKKAGGKVVSRQQYQEIALRSAVDLFETMLKETASRLRKEEHPNGND